MKNKKVKNTKSRRKVSSPSKLTKKIQNRPTQKVRLVLSHKYITLLIILAFLIIAYFITPQLTADQKYILAAIVSLPSGYAIGRLT